MSRYQKSMREALQEVASDDEVFNEAVKWEGKISGLPLFYVDGKSRGAVRQSLRKMLKRPDDIASIERTTSTELKKIRRGQAQGQEPGEANEEVEEMFSTRSLGLKGASKRSRDKAREKDKDSEKSKKKEEVELDEVHFSNRNEPPAPKGMHKLRSGRDVPSTPQVDKIHKKVVAMTDRNDHSGARIEIAKACGDKKLVQIYNALELAHDNYSGAVGNGAIELRNKFSPVLNKAIERKFGKYADVIQDAL